MALWPINSTPCHHAPFRRVRPESVLIELNGPSTFTFRDEAGSLMPAHYCDEEEGRLRHFVAPTDDRILGRLRAGAMSIRAALDQPLSWLVDIDQRGEVQACWVARLSELPSDAVPGDEVMLSPELEAPASAGAGSIEGFPPTVTISLDRDLKQQADPYAARHGIPFAEVVSDALKRLLRRSA